MTTDLRLVFMGTPAFAVPTLDALVAAGMAPVLVVTTPDAPGRRGRPDLSSAVNVAAERHGIPVTTPASPRDDGFADEIRAARADLLVVVAYKILPMAVIGAARLGAVNLHGSLLPRYRGAAPIQRAVMAGETETGVTTFRLDAGIDTGGMLLQARTPIGPDDTAGDVAARLSTLGAHLVVETVRGLAAGTLAAQTQDTAAATPAPKLFREEGELDWSRPAADLHNHARGFAPAPGAWTRLADGRALKVHRTRVADGSGIPDGAPGEVVAVAPDLVVACGVGALVLAEVQPEGRPRMDGGAFARGGVSVGDGLG